MIHGLDTGFLVAAEVREHVATRRACYAAQVPRRATSSRSPRRYWRSLSMSSPTPVVSRNRST